MRYEFDVQMDEKILYDFVMYHNYMGGSGIFWVMFGVFAIGLALFSGASTPVSYRLIYAMFGVLFIAYIPWDLKRKARKQLKTNPFYAKPIHYVIDEEGIHSSQDDKETTVAWKNFRKVKVSKGNVIVYMKNRNACVFPKTVFGKDLDKAVQWMTTMAGTYKRAGSVKEEIESGAEELENKTEQIENNEEAENGKEE